jgi:uncharacterized protein YndB with AHSA1/START domain
MDADRIERTLTLQAPIDEVWAALTEPEKISQWFSKSTELDLRPGGRGVLTWGEIVVPITVEEVEERRRFAYRWEPSHVQSGGPTTLVEFTLEEDGDATVLHLVESGFAALPPESRAENDRGWTEELGELQALVEARVGA